jgi:hypothetical protein
MAKGKVFGLDIDDGSAFLRDWRKRKRLAQARRFQKAER